MKRLAIATIVMVATLLVAQAVGKEEGAVSARIVGVRIIDGKFPNEAFEFSPFAGGQGTQLTLLLTSAEKEIVEVLHGSSSVESLTAGAQQDLLETTPETNDPAGFSFGSSPITPFTNYSKDRRFAVVEIQAPQTPSAGAHQIQLRAQLQVRLASGKNRVAQKTISLKPGELEVGSYDIAITGAEVKKHWSGEERFTVDLRFTGAAAESLESVRFLDSENQEIEIDGQSTMATGRIKMVSYPLKQHLETATIEFNFWRDLETATLPLDVTQSLGM